VEKDFPAMPALIGHQTELEIPDSEPAKAVIQPKTSMSGRKSLILYLQEKNKNWIKNRMKAKDGTGNTKISGTSLNLALDQLEPHPLQPRRLLEPKEAEQLAETIATNGLGTPLLVMPHKDDPDRYYILDGTRRWNAVKLLEWEKIACNIADALEDEMALGLMLTMDQTREDFNPIERGVAFKKLREMLEIGQRELANFLRIPQSEISRHEKLKDSLCDEVIALYQESADARLSFNHLRELARLGDHQGQQQQFYMEAMENKWTTKKLREEINNYLVVTPKDYKRNHKIKFQTSIFEVNIKAKRRHGILSTEVYSDTGAIVHEIFTWHGIRGEDIPKWYETMAEYSRKQWREERAKIQAQAVESEEET